MKCLDWPHTPQREGGEEEAGKEGKQENRITTSGAQWGKNTVELSDKVAADIRFTVLCYAEEEKKSWENVRKNLVTQSQTQLRFAAAAAAAITCHSQRAEERERERGEGGRQRHLLKDMWHLAGIVQRAEKYLHIHKCKQSTR